MGDVFRNVVVGGIYLLSFAIGWKPTAIMRKPAERAWFRLAVGFEPMAALIDAPYY
jgi:hypothetical protein